MKHNSNLTIKRQVINGFGKRGWVLTRCDGSQRVLVWFEVLLWKAFKAWPHDASRYALDMPSVGPTDIERMAQQANRTNAMLRASGNLKDRTDGVQ